MPEVHRIARERIVDVEAGASPPQFGKLDNRARL
jgi:hypothetical protein